MNPQEGSLPLEILARYWWLMAFRGILFLVYGALVFLWPEMSTLIPLILFAAYMLTNALLSFLFSLEIRKGTIRMRTFIAPAVVSGLIALGVIFVPGLSALALVGAVGGWSTFIGLMEISLAFHFRKSLRHGMALLIAGAVSCFGGLSLLIHPLYLFFSESHRLAQGSLLLGALLILLSFRVRHVETVQDR